MKTVILCTSILILSGCGELVVTKEPTTDTTSVVKTKKDSVVITKVDTNKTKVDTTNLTKTIKK